MIDVPQDVQQVVDQSDPRFQGTNAAPVIPGTQMPVPPLQAGPAPTAPNVGQNAPPVSGVDLLANSFLQHLLARTPPPPPQPSTGSFADKLKSAVNSVGASLGDAGEATRNLQPGQGWLTGVERTLGARDARQSRQKQQDFENQQATERAAREDAVAKQGMAESNIRMLHQQKLLHQLDESNIAADVAEGTKAVAALSTAPQPGNVIGKDLTSDQMHTMLAQKQLDPSTVTPYPTGRKQVGTDKDGNPTYATTYTLMSMPKSVTLDDTNRLLLKGVPGYDDMKAGTVLTGAQFNQLFQQAADIRTATQARDKTLADAEIDKDKTEQSLESVKLGPDWNNALANHQNDPVAALNTMNADPAMRAKYPHLIADVQAVYGGPKAWLDIQKAQETARHDKEEERDKLVVARERKAAQLDAEDKTRRDDIRSLEKVVEDNQKFIQKRQQELTDSFKPATPAEQKELDDARTELKQAQEKRNTLLGLHPQDPPRIAELKKIGDSLPPATRGQVIMSSPSMTQDEKLYLMKLYKLPVPAPVVQRPQGQ